MGWPDSDIIFKKILGAKVVKIIFIHDYIQFFLVRDDFSDKDIIINIYSTYEYNKCLSTLLKQTLILIKKKNDKIIFKFSHDILIIHLNSINEILEVTIDNQNEIIWGNECLKK